MELREVDIFLLTRVKESGRDTTFVELGESGGTDTCGRYDH
jgi:hypothetical protein